MAKNPPGGSSVQKPVIVGIALTLTGMLGLCCVGTVWLAFFAGKGAEYTFSTEPPESVVTKHVQATTSDPASVSLGNVERFDVSFNGRPAVGLTAVVYEQRGTLGIVGINRVYIIQDGAVVAEKMCDLRLDPKGNVLSVAGVSARN
jgi:hypothetical protein